MKNKDILYEMFEIYGNPTVDWMGFEVTKHNKITYHHITEARRGGLETIENGALLTKGAHSKLHEIELLDKELYDEYQYWFRIINDMRCKPSNEIMNIMYSLKKRLNYTLENKRELKVQRGLIVKHA